MQNTLDPKQFGTGAKVSRDTLAPVPERCWFVSGNDLTGTVVVATMTAILAVIKSRMMAFWHWLT